MSQFFEKNLNAIKQHRPGLYEDLLPEIEKLKQQPQGDNNESFQFVKTPSGHLNLLMHRKAPSFHGYYHLENPEYEIKKLFEHVDLKHASHVASIRHD